MGETTTLDRELVKFIRKKEGGNGSTESARWESLLAVGLEQVGSVMGAASYYIFHQSGDGRMQTALRVT